jgi:hypothetical protein
MAPSRQNDAPTAENPTTRGDSHHGAGLRVVTAALPPVRVGVGLAWGRITDHEVTDMVLWARDAAVFLATASSPT